MVIAEVFVSPIVHAIDFVVVADGVAHGSRICVALGALKFVPVHVPVVHVVAVLVIVGRVRGAAFVLHVTEGLPVVLGARAAASAPVDAAIARESQVAVVARLLDASFGADGREGNLVLNLV